MSYGLHPPSEFPSHPGTSRLQLNIHMVSESRTWEERDGGKRRLSPFLRPALGMLHVMEEGAQPNHGQGGAGRGQEDL